MDNWSEPPSDESGERHRNNAVICTGCKRRLRFADALYLTADAIVIKCDCRKEPLRLSSQSTKFEETLYRILAEGWGEVALPYSAAERAPLPHKVIDHKTNLFALAMLPIDTLEAFLHRCERASFPTSADGESAA